MNFDKKIIKSLLQSFIV